MIADRVRVGGQSVLTDKVISHIPLLMDQLHASIPLGAVLRVYDSSSSVDPFVPVLTITNDSIRLKRDFLLPWVTTLLSGTQIG